MTKAAACNDLHVLVEEFGLVFWVGWGFFVLCMKGDSCSNVMLSYDLPSDELCL